MMPPSAVKQLGDLVAEGKIELVNESGLNKQDVVKPLFFISHRLSSCKFCDRIAVFSDRHIAEYGTHDELVKMRDGIYATMFEAQAKYYRDVSA